MFPHRIHYCPTNRQPHVNILERCFSSIPLLILGPKSKFPLQSAESLPLSSSKSSYRRYTAMRCQEERGVSNTEPPSKQMPRAYIWMKTNWSWEKDYAASTQHRKLCQLSILVSYSSTVFSTSLRRQDLHIKRWSCRKSSVHRKIVQLAPSLAKALFSLLSVTTFATASSSVPLCTALPPNSCTLYNALSERDFILNIGFFPPVDLPCLKSLVHSKL